jgi:hypothetical protein
MIDIRGDDWRPDRLRSGASLPGVLRRAIVLQAIARPT